jgi:tellurite resistance protein TerC
MLYGYEPAMQFMSGYLIEKALSIDNIFIFLMIFSYFKISATLQHRVLFWGVFGAIVFRIIFILLGSLLLQKFHWIMYVFGAFLVFTGIKLLIQKETHVDMEHNFALRIFKKFVPMSADYRTGKFFVRENEKWLATPLLMVLIVIETTDIIFAVDSIPAIFAITSDPFIVYTSNIFAILGLRSLYFVLEGMMQKFHYIKIGWAFILVFVGVKMLLVDYYKFSTELSLSLIIFFIVSSVFASYLRPLK